MPAPLFLHLLRLAFALLLPLWAAAAQAQAPATVFLDELTWPELKERIARGTTTILVPIGGTEQNGPHMTLGKHNVRARLLAERIAQKLGNALVAPVVAYVPEGSLAPPTAHLRFPGTITVPEAAFEQMLAEAARSFKLHGFRDIVFLGDHGGYIRSLQAVAAKLDREWAPTPVRAHAITEYYTAADSGFAKLLAARGIPSAEIGTHAGLADTSLMLALDPRQVRSDRQQAVPARADGVYGDPRRASAELGQPGVDAIVTQTVAAIQRATARP
jgi:creatinine amidohydrolase